MSSRAHELIHTGREQETSCLAPLGRRTEVFDSAALIPLDPLFEINPAAAGCGQKAEGANSDNATTPCPQERLATC